MIIRSLLCLMDQCTDIWGQEHRGGVRKPEESVRTEGNEEDSQRSLNGDTRPSGELHENLRGMRT